MRAIVTGSSGFIGSHLSANLLQNNWQVVGIDNHSDYYSQDLKHTRLKQLLTLSNFHFENIDLVDFEKIREVVLNFRPNVIFHLAAQAGVRLPVSQLDRYVHSNLRGFTSILQIAVTERIPNFIYASSSSVYGDEAAIPYLETELNLRPNSFYGATKLSNEVLAKSLITHSDTKARGLRFFTVYGPSGRPDMAYFRIISKILDGKKFDLFGDGTVERDFTYIDDCIEMIVQLNKELSTREVGFHDVVNVGGGHPVSIVKLIELSSSFLNSNLYINKLGRNPTDVARTMADSNYLKQLVGIVPSIRIEEGLRQTIEWARNLPDKSKLTLWAESSI